VVRARLDAAQTQQNHDAMVAGRQQGQDPAAGA